MSSFVEFHKLIYAGPYIQIITSYRPSIFQSGSYNIINYWKKQPNSNRDSNLIGTFHKMQYKTRNHSEGANLHQTTVLNSVKSHILC